jgi:hypothetical protein
MKDLKYKVMHVMMMIKSYYIATTSAEENKTEKQNANAAVCSFLIIKISRITGEIGGLFHSSSLFFSCPSEHYCLL